MGRLGWLVGMLTFLEQKMMLFECVVCVFVRYPLFHIRPIRPSLGSVTLSTWLAPFFTNYRAVKSGKEAVEMVEKSFQTRREHNV
jgi:hypothetical protein